MAQHKQRSRIALFKSPFLVGIASAGAVLSGCGAKTNDSGVNPNAVVGTPEAPPPAGSPGATDQTTPAVAVTSNPPGVFWTCPATMPTPGDTCPDYVEGRVCGGDAGPSVRCVDGEWQGPPLPVEPIRLLTDCPVEMPDRGETCDEYEPNLHCDYWGDSSCPRNFTCSDGDWMDVTPPCNPPPPEPTTECPGQAPPAGTPCYGYAPGLVCTYDDAFGCPLHEECDEGNWVNISPGCIDSAALAADITSNPPGLTWECPTVGEDACGTASVEPDAGLVSDEPDGG